MDIIRVLRVIEYVGPRNEVEEQIDKSIHGQRKIGDLTIRVATLGTFPEILNGPEDPYLSNALPGALPRFRDPVFELKGCWWFWDETWSNKVGPFSTEKDAREGLSKYCVYLHKGTDATDTEAVKATDQPEPYFKY